MAWRGVLGRRGAASWSAGVYYGVLRRVVGLGKEWSVTVWQGRTQGRSFRVRQRGWGPSRRKSEVQLGVSTRAKALYLVLLMGSGVLGEVSWA